MPDTLFTSPARLTTAQTIALCRKLSAVEARV